MAISVIGTAIVILMISISVHVTVAAKKTYIVRMAKDEIPASMSDHDEWFASSLASVSDSAEMMYTYREALHGFAASLTEEEAGLMTTQPGVLSLIPEQIYKPLTTRSPTFLGLEDIVAARHLPETAKVSELVVGVLDTGVWPESPSFSDLEMPPIPKHWRGGCEFKASSCNKKLIGARSFSKGYIATLHHSNISQPPEKISPRDYDGHGTHTSTTAAGSIVRNASLNGFASGTARGMAVTARVAVYKVCWLGGCVNSDILAAMEHAISDRVDVLSLSLGSGVYRGYDTDIIALGAFSATRKGILVSCAAGNDGPSFSSVINVAPWILTVGAGTIDRAFPINVRLGNGKTFAGASLCRRSRPLSASIVLASNVSTDGNGLCINGTLIPKKVRNKIVFCERGENARVEKGLVVKEAGGAGMVLGNAHQYGEELIADAHVIPAAAVGVKAANEIKMYLRSQKSESKATILFGGTKLGVKPSPVVAAFSSRGPNLVTPEILKPDIIAPGVNILAGWSDAAGPTGLSMDNRRFDFNIISGTSMSCPHISGLALLLKASHPDWSPSMIRSALMTTSDSIAMPDLYTGKPSTRFASGAGQVKPVAALTPGLVYNLTINEYKDFLCAIKYTPSQIKTLTGEPSACLPTKKYSVNDLNYPSFAGNIQPGRKRNTTLVFRRTLTNVGRNGTYRVSIISPESAAIVVTPETLVFKKRHETKSYTLTVVAAPMLDGTATDGGIKWSDGKHVVWSPLALSWNQMVGRKE